MIFTPIAPGRAPSSGARPPSSHHAHWPSSGPRACPTTGAPPWAAGNHLSGLLNIAEVCYGLLMASTTTDDGPEPVNVSITVHITKTANARLAAQMSRARRSRSDMVRLAIDEYLDRQDRRGKPGVIISVR